MVCVRESLAADTVVDLNPARETSLHLARLWARDEVLRLLAARQIEAAVQLAAQYQIVTLVSGAVVLETKEQYQQTGLEPADPATVPAIPEPASRWFWLAGLVLLWLAGLGRKAR